jgi:hypothetical protein
MDREKAPDRKRKHPLKVLYHVSYARLGRQRKREKKEGE